MQWHWIQPVLDIYPEALYMQSTVLEGISSQFAVNKSSVGFSTLSWIRGKKKDLQKMLYEIISKLRSLLTTIHVEDNTQNHRIRERFGRDLQRSSSPTTL